jgi:hypothetical protein
MCSAIQTNLLIAHRGNRWLIAGSCSQTVTIYGWLKTLTACLGSMREDGERCMWLIYKQIIHVLAVENPRVGGSIPSLATIT